MEILTNIPNELLILKNPPKRLYFRGNLELLKLPKIAIVGSRKITFYTKNLIAQLSSKLKNSGICVVSGGAIGCDIIAHQAAYPQTIGVFANGLNQIYPKTNAKLISQIYENSLALSEYKPDFMPYRATFLERNRIVVALSKAIVIAQAGLNSGSFASANIALKLGIPIFVLPQRLDESPGTNLLLSQNRANLIYDFDDFCAKFSPNFSNLPSQNDEILNFIAKNNSLDECVAKFGSKIYEYELLGKVRIDGIYVSVT